MNSEDRVPETQPPVAELTPDRTPKDGGGWRETVESIVIALVLAFLFRTFEAEAFVIPTGSMATTLLGRHKDVECPECGIDFTVNASDEVDRAGRLLSRDRHSAVIGGICPNCNLKVSFLNAEGEVIVPSYKGDRILVSKQAYAIEDPRRWDVVVFRYPLGAATNYIKRLVGLPNETVKISQGDIFVRAESDDSFSIARKPPEKVEALLRGVHDNDHVPTLLREQGWPPRWAPSDSNGSTTEISDWRSDDGHRKFTLNHAPENVAWLAYHHIPASGEVWDAAELGLSLNAEMARPRLITDRLAYNSSISEYEDFSDQNVSKGLHWVGDLALECTVEIEQVDRSASLTLLLVEGGRSFTCEFNLNHSTAQLSIEGQPDFAASAQVVDLMDGDHRLRFANVDDQLLLWIDGRLVQFAEATTYAGFGRNVPTVEDLTPVRIGAKGAKLAVSHLEIKRDIYYIADRQSRLSDFTSLPFSLSSEQEIAQFFSSPQAWPTVFGEQMRTVEFALKEDQFFVLGDNSARSQDGRLWGSGEHYFDRELMIGKALMIYWPHAWETAYSVDVPGTDLRVPFYPNFSRMRRVR